MSGNPNHPVTQQLDSQWHKLCAIVMCKLGVTEIEIAAGEAPLHRQRRETFKAAKGAAEARRAELLSDPEYRRLLAEQGAAYRAREAVRGGGYRITVGIDMGFAFEVRAEGDNWAEVVRALKSREPNQLTVARVS